MSSSRREAFYEKMAVTDLLPSTAAPAPGAFEEAFRKAAADGGSVVCINLSSKLSATMQSAENAVRAVDGDIDVRVVDSRSITAGLGSQVEAAAKAASDGASADEIVDLVEDLRARTHIFGALDTLDNLKKGGRIGGAQAMLGTMLSIKPIVDISTGEVEEAAKQRTRRKAMAWLRDKVFATAPARSSVGLQWDGSRPRRVPRHARPPLLRRSGDGHHDRSGDRRAWRAARAWTRVARLGVGRAPHAERRAVRTTVSPVVAASTPSPSTPPASELTDRLLAGRYRLARPIASGGMAEVWEAVDEILARRVAIKILHRHLAADKMFVDRFRAEAIAAARLSHSSIVSIYDTFSDDGLEAIVMELVRGTTLRARLDHHGPLSVSEIADDRRPGVRRARRRASQRARPS